MYECALEMAGNAAKEEGKEIDMTMKHRCLVAPNGDHKVTIFLKNNEKFELTIDNDAVYQYLLSKQK